MVFWRVSVVIAWCYRSSSSVSLCLRVLSEFQPADSAGWECYLSRVFRNPGFMSGHRVIGWAIAIAFSCNDQCKTDANPSPWRQSGRWQLAPKDCFNSTQFQSNSSNTGILMLELTYSLTFRRNTIRIQFWMKPYFARSSDSLSIRQLIMCPSAEVYRIHLFPECRIEQDQRLARLR